jgi:hypothetical protein
VGPDTNPAPRGEPDEPGVQPLRQGGDHATRAQPGSIPGTCVTSSHHLGRLPTTDHQRLTTNDQRPTTNHQPPTTNHRPPTTDHQPSRHRLSFPADFDDADGIDDAVGGRHGQALIGHDLSQQCGRIGMRHRGLHADAHQAVGIVERLPRVAGDLGDARIGVTAARGPGCRRVRLCRAATAPPRSGP